MPYILALDQGTTSSRAIVFDRDGAIQATAQKEFAQLFPKPGWVEHDPEDIWRDTLATARQAIAESGVAAADIAAIGITNQRETTVLWDRATGVPDGATAKAVIARAADLGLLLLTCEMNGQVIRWIPPIDASAAEIGEAIGIFEETLRTV